MHDDILTYLIIIWQNLCGKKFFDLDKRLDRFVPNNGTYVSCK